jgi:hypothetical protein
MNGRGEAWAAQVRLPAPEADTPGYSMFVGARGFCTVSPGM